MTETYLAYMAPAIIRSQSNLWGEVDRAMRMLDPQPSNLSQLDSAIQFSTPCVLIPTKIDELLKAKMAQQGTDMEVIIT